MQIPSPPPRTLDVEEDMAFQRRNWRAERIGWAAMVAIVIAAVLGLFASGPLSWATAQTPTGPSSSNTTASCARPPPSR